MKQADSRTSGLKTSRSRPAAYGIEFFNRIGWVLPVRLAGASSRFGRIGSQFCLAPAQHRCGSSRRHGAYGVMSTNTKTAPPRSTSTLSFGAATASASDASIPDMPAERHVLDRLAVRALVDERGVRGVGHVEAS